MQPNAAVLLLAVVVTSVLVPRPAQSLSFDYPNFSLNPPDIAFQGSASASGDGVINLTPTLQPGDIRAFVVGRAIYRDPVPLWDGTADKPVVANFTTRFSFAVRPWTGANENVTGDGLAFFLAPYGSDIPTGYCFGHFFGLFNFSSYAPTMPAGTIPTVAIEFDTVANTNADVDDPPGVHVGIDVNNVKSVVKETWPEINTRVGANVSGTISYNAGTTELRAFFQSNGTQRTLSHVIDLSKVLPERVYVGLSAATGSYFQMHQILSWSFNSSLDLSDGPGPNHAKSKKLNIGLLVGVLGGVGALATGLVLARLWITRHRRRSRGRGQREDAGVDLVIDDGAFEGGRGPKRFAYRDLARATNNFATEVKLGRGGFGDVYRGVLNDPPRSMEVAIKRVAKDSNQGMREYVSEVKIISRLRHRNLVQLVGWCHEIEGELLLVYEYMPNSSLDAHLFGRSGGKEGASLSWPTRYGIAQGVAAALLYLHEEWEQCVVHRDVKPSNVMLDANFNAKLGDFGLARLVDHGRGPRTTVPAGTMGYLAPECATTGKASKESDVYSFGVVALEIACGKRPNEPAQEESEGLVEWVWNLYGRHAVLEAADPRLGSEELDEMQVERLMVVGLWCAHPDFRRRPSMRQVVSALNFETTPPNLPAEMPVPIYDEQMGINWGSKSWQSSSKAVTGSSSSSAGAHATGASAVSTASGGSAAAGSPLFFFLITRKSRPVWLCGLKDWCSPFSSSSSPHRHRPTFCGPPRQLTSRSVMIYLVASSAISPPPSSSGEPSTHGAPILHRCATVLSADEALTLTMQPTAFMLLLVVVITALHFPRPAQPLSFHYSNFSSKPPNITFQGSASASGDGVIDLTPIRSGEGNQLLMGRAVYQNFFRLWDTTATGNRILADFTTRFSFAVRPVPGNENYTGDGLAFFLAPYGSDIPANSAGGSLGLFNGSNSPSLPGFIPTVAVEFDTFPNEWDPLYVHVGIDILTIESVANIRLLEIDRRVGAAMDATISYDARTTNLSVFLQENGTLRNLFSVVDLSKVLPDRVYVGFSAATGGNVQFHQILSWSFNSSLVVISDRTGSDRNKNKKINIGLVVSVLAGVGALAAGAVLVWLLIARRRRRKRSTGGMDLGIDASEFEGGRGPKRFAYSDLARATKNFAAEVKLGKGGFGDVYRGVLSDPPRSMEVAIKRVAKDSRQGKKEYVSEVKIISRLRHRNLVQLVGWCHEMEGELLLVYEYMPNGSLDAHLYGRSGGEAAGAPLSWPTRYGIAHGVAAALLYLHEEWEQCVVHRDVKPSNVMLDASFNAKLGDFGLARLVDHGGGLQTTALAGTFGYLAPECATTGQASKESDVYSFGVVALEIACGRRPIEPTAEEGRVGLVDWVWNLYGRHAVLKAADPRLSSGELDETQIERLMVVGLWCAHPDFRRRPSMRQVVGALNFETPPPDLPAQMPVPTYGAPTGTDLSGKSWQSSFTPMTVSSYSSIAGGYAAGSSTVSTSSGGSASAGSPLLRSIQLAG
ncbi:hypothetical protein Taro_006204 [Colocasia esculenta]|uniref:non-specific serine/threonine protein kinase n=1 Tax=Colocasia esculenta TaxID=4460 RepID=A0A843TVD7_COLES|nr:hypothetical protein [Colocasia esculenta]